MPVPKVHFIPFFNCHSIQYRTSLKGMDLQEKEKKKNRKNIEKSWLERTAK